MILAELRWQSKPDGSYLSINEEERIKLSSVNLEDELLKAGYINANFKRIAEVVEKASDKPEFIGNRLVLFDRRKHEYIALEVQKDKVFLEINATIDEQNFEITAKDIEYLLRLRKIIHGIDWTLINQILNRKKYGISFLVAQDTPPSKGTDGRIIEHIKLDKESKPLKLSDGSVDFRNIGSIIQVKEEQLLASRIPPQRGTDGISILGNRLPAEEGKDVFLPGGAHTKINEENTELRANAEGYLYADGKNYAIGKLFVVPGDLNFKIGNIKYKGDVAIRGNVLPGFIVEAEGDVTIEGSVESATVISGANIKIKSGVYGKGKSLIKAKQSINLSQGQDATFIAGESIIFNSILSDSTLEAKSVLSKNHSAVMQNCNLKVSEYVKVSQIGSPTCNTSEIIFHDPHEQKIQDQIQDTYAKKVIMQNQLEGFARHLKSMKSIIAKSDSISSKSQEEIKKVFLQFQSTQTKIELLDKKMANLNLTKKEASHFKAKICSKLIFPLVKIQMLNESFEVKDALKNAQFSWENQKIKMSDCNFNQQLTSTDQI